MPEAQTIAVRSSGVDKALTDALRAGGVPKEGLAAAVALVRDLSAKGLKPVRGFPKGTPVFDMVTVEAHATPDQLGAILPFLARADIRAVNILTNGIPIPDIYRVQFDVNVQR
jgi:hypothetical protein